MLTQQNVASIYIYIYISVRYIYIQVSLNVWPMSLVADPWTKQSFHIEHRFIVILRISLISWNPAQGTQWTLFFHVYS